MSEGDPPIILRSPRQSLRDVRLRCIDRWPRYRLRTDVRPNGAAGERSPPDNESPVPADVENPPTEEGPRRVREGEACPVGELHPPGTLDPNSRTPLGSTLQPGTVCLSEQRDSGSPNTSGTPRRAARMVDRAERHRNRVEPHNVENEEHVSPP